MSATAWQACDLFRGARGFHVSAAIGKAHNRVWCRDIDKLRIWSCRVKGDPVRALQAVGEDLALRRRSAGLPRVKDAHPARSGFRQEDVAVRRDAKDAWHVEPGGEKIDCEAWRRLRNVGLGPGFVLRHVRCRARRIRRRQISGCDEAAHARSVRTPVAECRGASADRVVGKRRRRADKPEENEKSESHSSHLGDDNLRLKPARALGGSCLTSALLSNHIEFIANAWAGACGEKEGCSLSSDSHAPSYRIHRWL